MVTNECQEDYGTDDFAKKELGGIMLLMITFCGHPQGRQVRVFFEILFPEVCRAGITVLISSILEKWPTYKETPYCTLADISV